MVWIRYFKEESPDVQIKFSGSSFYELLELCKSLPGVKFNSDLKTWECSPFYFENSEVLVQLQNLDSVSMDEQVYAKIKKDSVPVLEIKKERRKYFEDLVNFVPVKGLPPNETFQLDDIKKFLYLNRGGIFWEQGLGKAVFISVHLTQLFANDSIDKAVILTPSSGLYNIRREILKFSKFFKKEEIQVITKDERHFFEEENASIKVIIMTYRTFLLLSDHHYKLKKPKSSAKKYKNPTIPFENWIKKDAVIYLDESHNIANYNSRQSYVIHLHKGFFKFRYNLSGTPAEKVEKFYSQIKFLDSNLIPHSYTEWLSTIFNIGNRFSQYAINYAYPDKVKKFISTITPYISQRKTEDHIELPENVIKKVYVHLHGKQKEIYQSFIKYSLTKLKEEKGKLVLNDVKNKFSQLSLSLRNPEIISNIEESVENKLFISLLKKWKFQDHCKLEVLDDLVEEIVVQKNEKLIIWDGHPLTMNYLLERYKKFSPLIIHGGVDFKEKGFKNMDEYRDHIVQEFKNPETKILIASYKVLSTAVTLTECHHQVYFTRDWDLVNWSQSLKRIHRISQKKTVFTYVLIFEETLEEIQDAVLEHKANINDKVLKADFLTKEEWENLFNGKNFSGEEI